MELQKWAKSTNSITTSFIIFKVYSCEIQVVPNEIIFVEEKADYPWTQMLRWVMQIFPPG